MTKDITGERSRTAKRVAAERMKGNPNVFKEIGLIGGLRSTGWKVLSRPVVQCKNGESIAEFPSIHEASRVTGVPVPSIHANLKGRMVQAGGYVWQYKPV